MSSDALLLVVGGALLHALWNALAKRAAGGLPFVWLFGLVSAVAAAPMCVASWLAVPTPLGGAAWLAIAASALVHVGYSLVLQAGYRNSDFSIVYPLARGTGPLFAVLGAIVVLGEMPSPLGWFGIATVLLGIFFVAGGARLLAGGPDVLPGVLWGGLTGLFIATYTVIDGWAVKTLGLSPVLYYSLGLALRTLILAPQALRRPSALASEWRRNARAIVTVGILSPLAYLLVLQAVTLAPLSYVAPVRELSMLVGVVIGARVLREAFVPSRAVGTTLMVAGVVMLVFAR